MKDKIKILLEKKTNARTIEDLLYNIWDKGVNFGDEDVLMVLGFNMVNPRNKAHVQQIFMEYLGKKIGTTDETKILEYWKQLIMESLPKLFTIEDYTIFAKFSVSDISFYKISQGSIYGGLYVIDIETLISDDSGYTNEEDEKVLFVDMEEDFTTERLIGIVEADMRAEVDKFTKNFLMRVSEVSIVDTIKGEKMLKEEQEEKKDRYQYYIDGVNDDDEEIIEEIESIFGGLDTFFKLLIGKKRFHEIDFHSSNLVKSDRYNKILYALSQIDTPETFKIIETAAGMRDIVEEDGVYYWWDEREDWASLFRESRDGVSLKTIEELLSGNFDDWDYWDSYYESPYSTYEELTDENKHRVNRAIKECLLGKEMTTDYYEMTPVLSNLLKLQKSEDTITLTSLALDMILNDEKSVEMLLKNNSLDDILQDDINLPLSRALDDAKRDAYWADIYNGIFDEIVDSGYADNFKNYTWVRKPHRKSDGVKFEITKNLKSVLYSWLNEFKDYGDDIGYYGSYIEMIKSLGDFESLRYYAPDYPSHKETIKSLNSHMIKDQF